MTRTYPTRPVTLVAALTLGVAGLAATMAAAEQTGGKTDAAEAQAFQATPMTLGDAAKAAEAKTGGKAMSAEFDNEDKAAGTYKVEIVTPDGATTYAMVDPADGSVKPMAAGSGNDMSEGEDAGTGSDAEDNDSN